MVPLFGEHGSIAIAIGDNGIIALDLRFRLGVAFKIHGYKPAFGHEALAHDGGIGEQPKGIGGCGKELDALGIACSTEGQGEDLLRATKLAELFL